jgi:hypothetical protein
LFGTLKHSLDDMTVPSFAALGRLMGKAVNSALGVVYHGFNCIAGGCKIAY